VVYADVNMFTDREKGNKITPSEIDWIVGLALRYDDVELSFYREEDRPVDRQGLVQKYLALQLRFAFDVPKRMVSGLNPFKSAPTH
jgi:hypothetical protein